MQSATRGASRVLVRERLRLRGGEAGTWGWGTDGTTGVWGMQ